MGMPCVQAAAEHVADESGVRSGQIGTRPLHPSCPRWARKPVGLKDSPAAFAKAVGAVSASDPDAHMPGAGARKGSSSCGTEPSVEPSCFAQTTVPRPVPEASTGDAASSCSPLGTSPLEPRLGPPTHTASSVLLILRSLLDGGDQDVRPSQLAADAAEKGLFTPASEPLTCAADRALGLHTRTQAPPFPSSVYVLDGVSVCTFDDVCISRIAWCRVHESCDFPNTIM